MTHVRQHQRKVTTSGVRKDRAARGLDAILATVEPALAKAILAGLEDMADDASLDEVAAAIATGDVGKVMAALRLTTDGFTALTPAIQSSIYAAGAITAASIAASSGVRFGFDVLNPRLIQWLQTYSLGLIREIDTSTKEAIRSVLVTGMNAGQNPRTVARDVKGIVGLTERQARAVGNYRKELETFHTRRTGGGYKVGGKIDRVNGFQVLRPDADGDPMDGITERRLRDFRYDGQLQRAMGTGKPLSPAQIDKMVAAYERKYLAYRSRTIARTEALRTTNVGVQDAWRQAIETQKVPAALVRRQWVVAKDERLCEVCGPIPAMNPKRGVEFDKAFNTPKGPWSLPPIHPNCRCTVFIRQWEPEQLAPK